MAFMPSCLKFWPLVLSTTGKKREVLEQHTFMFRWQHHIHCTLDHVNGGDTEVNKLSLIWKKCFLAGTVKN